MTILQKIYLNGSNSGSMKKIICILLNAIAFNMVLNAQIEGVVQWEKDKDFTFRMIGEYTEIVSESGCIEAIGAPQIPYCTKTFLVPTNAQVSVQVVSVNKKVLDRNVLLYPVQPPIPVGSESPTWVKPDDTIYSSLNPFPGKYAEIISDREDFGYHLVTVRFYPLEYIPQKRELYLCDIAFSLTYPIVRTSVSLSTVEKQSEYLDRLDKDYIRSIIENKDMLIDIAPNIKRLIKKESNINEEAISRSRQTSVVREQLPEYLIITNEALKETFQVLADWKTKKGIPAIVETVENIATAYPGSDLQEKIRNYLINVRRTYGYLFILLGGDTNVIPARIKKSRSSASDWVAVDFYYACVERGNWNANGNNVFFESGDFDPNRDWGWSFKLGRAPVENQAEAELFVNKILHYEKADKDIDYSYIKNSMAADAFISKDENTGELDDSGRTEIAGYYNGTGLNRWLIYDHYNCRSNTTTCNGRHTGDTIIDISGRGEELNKANFVAALRNGGNSGLNHFHLIYHMDHSGPLSMGASQKDKNEVISTLDVDNLDNQNYYHILMSGGCSPADITKDCIAEHFLNNSNGGAVAFLGNTDSGYSREHVQFNKFLLELYKTDTGTTNRYDLSILHQKAIANIDILNCRLHLFGDPEMQVWTDAPKTFNAAITPASLQTGENVITVTLNGLPQNETARVCVQKGDELYVVEQLGNGTHAINAFVQTAGVVSVTITAHNFRPLEKDIQVSQVGSTPTLAIADLVYKDNGTGTSIGNGDGQLDAGETIELTVKLRNTGNSALSNVIASLTSTSDDVEVIMGQTSFDVISGSAVAISKTPCLFKINSNSEEHLKNSPNAISLNLQISVGGNTKTELFKIEDIYAPEIQIGNQKVTWTSNGNTTVDPGETVKMNIDLTNISKAEATGLKAVLVSNNAQVSCSSTPIAYPDISASETKTNAVAFQFQTSSSYTGSLNFTLNVTNEYGKTWSFPVNPLSRPATVNVSTVNSQRYSSSISVYWTPIRSVAGYNIYRSDNGENGTYQKLNRRLLTAAYYLDENLAGCSVYHYKVTAISGNGNESGLSLAYRTWTSYPVVSPFPLRLTTATYQTGSCPNIADVDNDGKQEIFELTADIGTLSSYLMAFRPTGEELYNIDNNVTTVSGFAKMRTLSQGQVAFGDLYSKGEQNIVASTWNDRQGEKNGVCCYSAFDRNGDQNPDLLWEAKIPYSSHQSPVVANLDGSSDGSMEVIIKSHQTPDIYILDNNGNELRRLNPNIADAKGMDNNYSALTVADLDNDGQMEIIASYNVLGIYIWRYDGTPFTENPFWGAGIEKLSSAPVVCDLNEDGKKEIIFSQNNIAISHVYAISLDGDKTVAGWNGSQTIPYTDNNFSLDHTLSVGDINNDGHLEVVILGHGVVKVWKHTGELIFSKEIKGLFPEAEYAANENTPVLADVDGDAVPDIVFCSGRNIYALHNDGSEIIGFPIVVDEDLQDTPCVADIDKDGKNELIANNKYDLYVWKTAGVPSAIEWGTKRGNSQNTGEYFSTVCEPMLITADKVWDGESPCGNVVLQSGKLVIPAGKTMTLGATSAIIVRAGATLEVDGGAIREANIKAQDGSAIIIKNNGCIKLKKNAGLRMEKGARLDYQHGRIDLAD